MPCAVSTVFTTSARFAGLWLLSSLYFGVLMVGALRTSCGISVKHAVIVVSLVWVVLRADSWLFSIATWSPFLTLIWVLPLVLGAVYGVRPLIVRMGGTVPIAELLQRHMGLDTVFFSFSTADEDYHAPNEFFRVHRLHEGLEAWARYWAMLGELQP